MPRRGTTKTMPPFNNGVPLEVVCVQDHDGNARVGIVAKERGGAMCWFGYDLTPVPIVGRSVRVTLPSFPEYGKWVTTSIGGVSSTVRRQGILRALSSHDPVVVFCTQGASPTHVRDALADHAGLTFGDTVYDETYKYVTEVTVRLPDDVATVCARVARAGAVPMLEDASVCAERDLGIERLDRIGAHIVTDESMVHADDDVFGLRRGTDNWKFSWCPKHWRKAPITWDHLVENVVSEPIEQLPQPLRQHVAKTRIERSDYPRIGSSWEVCSRDSVPSAKVLEWNRGLADDFPLQHMLSRVVSLSEEDKDKVVFGCDDVDAVVTLNCVTQINGVWYRPTNTRAFLDRCMLRQEGGVQKRWVTPHLSTSQSKQLINAFYLLTVERVTDATLHEACKLILFRYMLERGYTARWIGKYRQSAHHVGNGDRFRRFSRLYQYAPHCLPTEVLNKLCGRDGRLRNKGSKGTRSKYKQSVGTKRYTPTRRLKRTEDDERRMLA